MYFINYNCLLRGGDTVKPVLLRPERKEHLLRLEKLFLTAQNKTALYNNYRMTLY